MECRWLRQGRSHAVRLAQDGADVIAVDICGQIDSVAYPLATPADLARTVSEVQALGRCIVAVEADVRDAAAVRAAVASGVAVRCWYPTISAERRSRDVGGFQCRLHDAGRLLAGGVRVDRILQPDRERGHGLVAVIPGRLNRRSTPLLGPAPSRAEQGSPTGPADISRSRARGRQHPGGTRAFSSASCVTRRGWRDGDVDVLSSRILVQPGRGSQDTEPVIGSS